MTQSANTKILGMTPARAAVLMPATWLPFISTDSFIALLFGGAVAVGGLIAFRDQNNRLSQAIDRLFGIKKAEQE